MNNRIQLEAAIESLRYNKEYAALSFGLPPLSNKDSLEEYFNAPFDSITDKNFEKIIATAAINSTYKSNIPQKKKEKHALKLARAIIERLRYLKLGYQYETDKISAREYQTRLKENNVAQKIVRIEAIKKKLLFEGVKVGLSAALGTIAAALGVVALPAWAIGLITWGLFNLVPHKVIATVKEKSKKLIDQGKNIAKSAVTRLCDAGEKIGKKIWNTGKEIWNTTKSTVKKLWNKETQ